MSIVMFWFVAFALVAGIVVIFAAALRRDQTGTADQDYDISIYRDQLREVERDIERGMLSAEDGERARVEISRRILDADRTGSAVVSAQGPSVHVTVAVLATLIFAGAGVSYLMLGAQGYPDVPLDKRLAEAQEMRDARPSQAELEAGRSDPEMDPETPADIVDLMDKLRTAVATRPDDLRGAELLARQEANFGNFIAARAAQDQVVRIKGDAATAQDLSQQAFLMINAAGGPISPEAEQVLITLLQKDPSSTLGTYYSGLMFAQTDRPDLAFRLWRGIVTRPDPDPFVDLARANIGEAAFLAGIDYELPTRNARGPSAEDIAAAQDLSEEDRAEMIRGMVTGLEDRLATEGGSVDDWARLIRAYGVLGETGRASTIWNEARSVFAADPAAMNTLRNAARDAGAVN